MDQDAQQLYDKLEEYQEQLQTFKAQADQLGPSAKAYVDPHIKQLEIHLDAVKAKLEAYRQEIERRREQREEAWKDIKSGADMAWKDILSGLIRAWEDGKEAIESAVSRLRQS